MTHTELDIEKMPDKAIWKSFGLKISRETGCSWFIFDPEKGDSLFDNIMYVRAYGGFCEIAYRLGCFTFDSDVDVNDLVDLHLFENYFK